MFATSFFAHLVDTVDSSPWGASAGRHLPNESGVSSYLRQRSISLYTAEEKLRRDASPWTLVQGILAPVQFVIFAVSLVLVLRYLATGDGQQAATISVLVKTGALYTIMITGAIWEREIFGQYLFAPAFWWEDAVSMVVITLHTAYLAALMSGSVDTQRLMLLALAAYATYLVNAAQFVLKLRAARLAERTWSPTDGAMGHA